MAVELFKFRHDACLLVGEEKIPVCIDTIRESWDSFPEFEGHFLELGSLLNRKEHSEYDHRVRIKKVVFNNPATIVLWEDGTKTVVKCQPGDIYDKEMGLALCIAKKALGNKSNFNNVFKKWIPDEPTTITDVIPIEYETNNNLSDVVNNFYKNVQNFFGGNKND